jgi:hypothetical protein
MEKANELLTSRLTDLHGKASVTESALKAVDEWMEWADTFVMLDEDISLAKKTTVKQPKGE